METERAPASRHAPPSHADTSAGSAHPQRRPRLALWRQPLFELGQRAPRLRQRVRLRWSGGKVGGHHGLKHPPGRHCLFQRCWLCGGRATRHAPPPQLARLVGNDQGGQGGEAGRVGLQLVLQQGQLLPGPRAGRACGPRAAVQAGRVYCSMQGEAARQRWPGPASRPAGPPQAHPPAHRAPPRSSQERRRWPACARCGGGSGGPARGSVVVVLWRRGGARWRARRGWGAGAAATAAGVGSTPPHCPTCGSPPPASARGP